MPKLKFKTLAFYTTVISSVLLLFKIVTAYGENNLKAPIAISRRYRLTNLENLPNCQKPDTLMLNIQQSGMFLNGSLLSTTNTKEKSQAKIIYRSLANSTINNSPYQEKSAKRFFVIIQHPKHL